MVDDPSKLIQTSQLTQALFGEPPPGLSSIDLTILVSPDISVRESHDIESRVRERIMSERRDAREVKIHIHGVEPGEMEEIKKEKDVGGCDFGRDGC